MVRDLEPDPRLVCVGANLESQVILEGLIDIKANIVGLVTLPIEKSNNISDYVDLHPMCNEAGIDIIDAIDINNYFSLQRIRLLRPDYIFTLGWSQLFGEQLLKIPEKYVVGSHPSLLPEGRGRAPIPWTILQRLKQSGVTLFKMDRGVDTGPVLMQKIFDISDEAYAMDVYFLAAQNLRSAFCELYIELKRGQVAEISQDVTKANYRAKRGPSDGHIDFNNSAADIEALVRAVSKPFPGSYVYYQGEKIYVWKASLQNVLPYIGTIGQILTGNEDSLLVQAKDKPLWLSNFTDDAGPVDINYFRTGSRFNYIINEEICKLWQEIEALKRGK
ncbi:MAG: formyltransferase family protein [Eubacteriales bacterium]|jgi:methionyl-tRNA formyltransferase